MEIALKLLKRDELLSDWSDRAINPGSSINGKIKTNLDNSDIVVFLLSPDFINSDACFYEWEYVKERSMREKVIRIPIILRECPWLDFIKEDLLALPNDGHPILTLH